MKVLCGELKQKIRAYNISKFETIFIGGGTPSSVSAQLYRPIFNLLEDYIDDSTEATTEANPNTATKQWLKDMRDMGVNRLSLGVQSLRENKLKYLGRTHDRQTVIKAINDATKVGYDNINCDIIYNVDGDTADNLQNDIKDVLKLGISHISTYSLTIESGTPFAKKSIKAQDNKDKIVCDILTDGGFEQYEVSAWAKNSRYICRHNLGYWQHKPYIGIGAGAVGCVDGGRYKNFTDVSRYIDDPNTVGDIENLSKEDIITEKTMLGLRSMVGCDMDIFSPKQSKKIAQLVHSGKLIQKKGKIYNHDYMIADELCLYIL